MMTGIPMGCRFLFVDSILKQNIHHKGREGREGREGKNNNQVNKSATAHVYVTVGQTFCCWQPDGN